MDMYSPESYIIIGISYFVNASIIRISEIANTTVLYELLSL